MEALRHSVVQAFPHVFTFFLVFISCFNFLTFLLGSNNISSATVTAFMINYFLSVFEGRK